jgi:hypothetical protein
VNRMFVAHRGKSAANVRENPRAALVLSSGPPPRAQTSPSATSQVTGAQIKVRATILTSGKMLEQARRRAVVVLGPEAPDSFDATVVLEVDERHSIVPRRGEAEPTL